MKYSILIMMKSTAAWLSYSKDYRKRLTEEVLFPLLHKFTDQLQIRVFSAEAFHAGVSDYIQVETTDLEAYYHFIQELRASKIFSEELFTMEDVIVSCENGFREFNEKARLSATAHLN